MSILDNFDDCFMSIYPRSDGLYEPFPFHTWHRSNCCVPEESMLACVSADPPKSKPILFVYPATAADKWDRDPPPSKGKKKMPGRSLNLSRCFPFSLYVVASLTAPVSFWDSNQHDLSYIYLWCDMLIGHNMASACRARMPVEREMRPACGPYLSAPCHNAINNMPRR